MYVSRKMIAEESGTSTGTLSKYAAKVREFVMDRIDKEMLGETEQPAVMTEIVTEMGTDPRMAERVLWEMLKLSQSAGSQTEIKNVLQNPNTNLQQMQSAQLLCYEAFEASGKERERLARQAFELDPKSGDANLLMAEFAEHDIENRIIIYRQSLPVTAI